MVETAGEIEITENLSQYLRSYQPNSPYDSTDAIMGALSTRDRLQHRGNLTVIGIDELESSRNIKKPQFRRC